MTMRWGMVTDKPQEFLGRSLCRTPQGYPFGVSCDYVTKLWKDFRFGERENHKNGKTNWKTPKPRTLKVALRPSGVLLVVPLPPYYKCIRGLRSSFYLPHEFNWFSCEDVAWSIFSALDEFSDAVVFPKFLPHQDDQDILRRDTKPNH